MVLLLSVICFTINVAAADYAWPVDISAPITATMYYSSGKYHGGTDFGVSVGSEVYAIADGTVITANDRGVTGPDSSASYGNWIIIDHGNSVYSLYAHLKTGGFQVSVGDYVLQGQTIAYSGNAGNVTGPHLHLELRMGGNTYKTNNVNPLDYLTKINVDPDPVPPDGTLAYSAHVEYKGWLSTVSNGETAGTTGENRCMEAIRVFLNNDSKPGICYSVHMSDVGWMEHEVYSGEIAGTVGESRPIEAITMDLCNGMENIYDLYFRVHMQDVGWTGWATSREVAGSVGHSIPLEAYEVRLVGKGEYFDRGGRAFYGENDAFSYELDVNGWTDNKKNGTTEGYATFDVYVNGTRVANNVMDYCETVAIDSTYEIKDIRVSDGKSFEGYSSYAREGHTSGWRTGKVTANTDVRLILNTVDAPSWVIENNPSKISVYNGHSYYFYDSPATWYEAKLICEQLEGHLVTITSADENAFVKDMIGDYSCWIGATDRDSEGTWKWVTGEAVSYKNWKDGQPDNNTGGNEGSENFAHIWENSNMWNDNCGERKMPFACETDVAYQIIYDCNGGDDSIESQVKAVGQSIMITDKIPTRDGYEFKGWAKTKTAAVAQYTAGEVYSTDADIILYAVWEKLEPDFILPDSLITIEEEAFTNCSFTYVKIPETTTSIGKRAFSNCQYLTHIYIPETTTIIAADAFSGVDDSLTIHGVKGSYAEFYAGKYGFQFVEE